MMVARYTGATLGLLAFTLVALTGLTVENPVEVTLSRAIFALFLFCALGLLVGAAVETVLVEYRRTSTPGLQNHRQESSAGKETGGESAASDKVDGEARTRQS